ncbi:unnamed protein product [Rhizophagus irregularis]|nr:unnamed protein product [Rhizophagus irregularis]
MYEDSVLICCHSISLEVIVKISSSSVSFALPLPYLWIPHWAFEALTTPSSASTESESKSESSSNLQLIIISTITKV